MGKKFYSETEQGDTIFKSERRVWEVRLPIYVYDMWLPIIGAVGMGVYSLYCRLEMNDQVKGVSQAKIAKACRIGTRKLAKINEQLEDCGFIRVEKPEGHERLMHYTTVLVVLDPPQTVSKVIKEKYQPPSEYEILTKWLEADPPEMSNDISEDVKQKCVKESDDNANVVTLGLEPLDLEVPPSKPKAEPSKKSISAVLRGTLTKSDDEIERSPLAEYIGQQFGSTVPPGQCNKLALGYTEQLPGGKKRKHPSPDELWVSHPLYPQWVEERIAYIKGKPTGSNHAQRGKAVNAVCQYKGNHYAWLEWLARHKQNGVSGLSGYVVLEQPPVA